MSPRLDDDMGEDDTVNHFDFHTLRLVLEGEPTPPDDGDDELARELEAARDRVVQHE